jgi:hypothetical protein
MSGLRGQGEGHGAVVRGGSQQPAEARLASADRAADGGWGWHQCDHAADGQDPSPMHEARHLAPSSGGHVV